MLIGDQGGRRVVPYDVFMLLINRRLIIRRITIIAESITHQTSRRIIQSVGASQNPGLLP